MSKVTMESWMANLDDLIGQASNNNLPPFEIIFCLQNRANHLNKLLMEFVFHTMGSDEGDDE